MLTIDDREASAHPDVVNFLSRQYSTDIKRCDFGDYVFTGLALDGIAPRIGIELCTPSDLAQKANSDRLAYQLGNMMDVFNVSYLMVTSPLTNRDGYVNIPGAPTAMKWERLTSLMDGAQAHGVRVVYCANSLEIGSRIARVIEYWLKAPEEHKYFRPRKALPQLSMPIGPPIDERVLTLMSFPGIGEQRAIDALRTFGSIAAIITSKPEALATIPGWGKITAERFRNYITEFVAAQ